MHAFEHTVRHLHKVIIFAVVCMLRCPALGQLSGDRDELLGWCLDAQYHKTRPGPEDSLHGQCTPWKEKSCCTLNTTTSVHNSGHYNLNWNHCDSSPMSFQCRRHFVQDLCFYECEPNVGPWVTKVDMKIRKERFFGIPLCASDCEVWFEDCRNDYTCVDNWTTKFVWKNGKNRCPVDLKCLTIAEIFKDAKHFCESIFDGSWRYTPDTESCMRLYFNASHGNPNEAVARRRVDELMANWSGQSHRLIANDHFITILIMFAVNLGMVLAC